MNKEEINRLIPQAYEVLQSSGIVENNTKIKKSWRGQISSFGAAVCQGSLISAVAFFSDDGSSDLHREYLMKAIYDLLYKKKEGKQGESNAVDLYLYVKNHPDKKCKEEIINASIAIKLAMNLYDLY